MSVILQIETSTAVCSVAIAIDGVTVALKERNESNIHAGNLTLFIQEVAASAKIELATLDAVAVAKGPGSYTGLRIGVSTAKGICFALDKPLIAIDTLHIMAAAFKAKHPDFGGMLCPMIDARRMEVYTTVFDAELQSVVPITAEVINESSFADLLKVNRLIFFGDGAAKCKHLLQSENAFFVDGNYNSAAGMSLSAKYAFQKQQFENVAYFEPFYLKDFMLTQPKTKLVPFKNSF